MRRYLLKNNHFTWLRILLIILLVLGVFFRLVNLDRKVYWYDEGFTSLRVGGYTIPEVVQQSFNGQVISVADLGRYLSPNSGRGFYGTLKSLAVEDPQHPPIYYLMTHLWMQWFGNSVAAIRSLPALISLLVFPCTYWLCIELFKSSLTGWIAMAIIAVSPFHVLFAQEAREYSLWTVTILLTSTTLLRAMRLKTVYSWGIYALTLAISLYTFLFSIFIAIGHGIYVISCENHSKTVIAYLKATFISFVAFVPWVLVIINSHKRLNDSTSWMTTNTIPLLQLAYSWVNNIGDIFFKSTKFDNLLLTLIIILVGYSFYFIYNCTAKTVWLFIITLFGVTALSLLVPDIIFGGQRAIQARFLIPCYLSIQLTVSHLMATKISFKSVAWQQKFWLILTLAIFTGGVISSAIYSQSEVPWTKLKNSRDYKIARTINQASNPLVVVSNYPSNDNNVSYLFSFSHLLDPKVKLQLVDGNNIPKIPKGFSNIFIYNPCVISTEKQGLANEFKVLLFELKQKQNYQAEPVKISQPVLLWRLEKRSVNT